MIKRVLLLIVAIAISGCTPHLQVSMPDKTTHRFETSEKVDRVIVSEKINSEKYNKLLLIGNDSTRLPAMKFFVESFRNTHLFELVMTLEELKIFLGQSGATYNYNDLNELANQLDEQFGDVLFLTGEVRKPSGQFSVEGNLKVYDGKSSRLLLHLYHKSVAWDGLDKPMFYPLFNGFIDWAEQNQM